LYENRPQGLIRPGRRKRNTKKKKKKSRRDNEEKYRLCFYAWPLSCPLGKMRCMARRSGTVFAAAL
jgi:hypothetical protein